MNKIFIIITAILFTTLFISCEKNGSLTLKTVNDDQEIDSLMKQIMEEESGVLSSITWNPPKTGVYVSNEGILIFENEDVFESFVFEFNNASESQLDSWEKEIGFLSIRRNTRLHEDIMTNENGIVYPFNDFLMSSITNKDGYVIKNGFLSRITNEGVYTKENDSWVFYPLEESESSKYGIQNRRDCLDDDDYCNDFWDESSHRLTGSLYTTSSWGGFYSKINGRTSHDLKQDCPSGFDYCDYPADAIAIGLIAYTSSGQKYITTSSTYNSANIYDQIYVSINTCWDSAKGAHLVKDDGLYYSCKTRIRK